MIAEPLLSFCFAGVVPGTHAVVDPDTMLMAVAAILGLGIAGGLLIWLRRMVAVRHAAIAATAPQAAATTYDAPGVVQPAKPTLGLAARDRTGRSILPGAYLKYIPSLTYRVHQIVAVLRLLLLRGLRVLLTAIIWLGAWTMWVTAGIIAAAKEVICLARSAVTTTARSVTQSAVLGARWAYPRLQVIDRWLELQTRRFTTWCRRTLLRQEVVQVLAEIARDSRRSLRHLLRRG